MFSFVIHLLDDGTLPYSPLDLAMPNGQEVITFHYGSIEVSKLTPEDIWQTGKPSLLTLLPLTKKGARREIVEQMSAALHQNRNVDLEVVGQAFASLAFRTSPEDQDWLLRRFRRMHDILKDTPLMQEIIKWGREEGLKQGLKEGREEGLKEGLKEGSLNSSRHIFLSFVEARFPSLKTQAQRLATKIQQPEDLERLILKIGLAQTAEEAQQHLLVVKIPRAKPRARRTRPSD